jgi:hypothetical protein
MSNNLTCVDCKYPLEYGWSFCPKCTSKVAYKLEDELNDWLAFSKNMKEITTLYQIIRDVPYEPNRETNCSFHSIVYTPLSNLIRKKLVLIADMDEANIIDSKLNYLKSFVAGPDMKETAKRLHSSNSKMFVTVVELKYNSNSKKHPNESVRFMVFISEKELEDEFPVLRNLNWFDERMKIHTPFISHDYEFSFYDLYLFGNIYNNIIFKDSIRKQSS